MKLIKIKGEVMVSARKRKKKPPRWWNISLYKERRIEAVVKPLDIYFASRRQTLWA